MNTPSRFLPPEEIVRNAEAFRKKKDPTKCFRIVVLLDTGDTAYKTELEIYLYCPDGVFRAYYSDARVVPQRFQSVEIDEKRTIWENIADSLEISAMSYCRTMYKSNSGSVFRHRLKVTFAEGGAIPGRIVKAGHNSYALE